MAKLKALFTTRNDFETKQFSFDINPFIYFDGENMPTDVSPNIGSRPKSIQWIGGEAEIVDGVVGKASKFGTNGLVWRNWGFPKPNKFSLAFWVKFAPSDLQRTWTILATTRGDTTSDKGLYGFHLAVWNDILNVRVYSTTASYDTYTNYPDQSGKTFEANKWYHVTLIFDGTYVKAIVNGEEWISFYAGNFTFYDFERSFTVGDMPSSTGSPVYPFDGSIDEVIYAYNEDAWTVNQAIEYYNTIKNGEFFDNQTIDGALQLGKDINGNYPTKTMSWISPTIDLGGQGKFVDYGYIEAASILPEGTSLTFYTRSSFDGKTWEDWIQVASDGKIQSSNLRFVQVRVDFKTNDPTKTPILEELRIYEEELPPEWIPLPNMKVNSDDPLRLYRDLEGGLKSLGTLRKAYDIFIEEQINGEEILRFKLPKNDKKRQEIGEDPVELIAQIGERFFIVKEVIDRRDGGQLYTEFICEARWTELRDWYCGEIEVVEVTARKALETIFSSIFREEGDPEFDWKIGNVEITKRRTLRSEWKDVLSLIREVQNIWGGEVLFDTKEKRVHLLERIGKDTGIRFQYNKNLKNIERIIDTYDLVTRIYPQGKGGLDIRTVNNGVPYLENREWVDKLKLRRKIIPYRWKDERYTIPQNLKEDAQKILDEKSKPRITYLATIQDLSPLPKHEHESFNLGDTIIVVDKELFDEEVVNRIVRRKMDVRKPENTEIEISQPVKTLADIRSRALDEEIETMLASDPLSTNDVQQMTVFNYLLNSRADEGINADWVQVGTDFDIANVGFSGNWSFKVTPDFGRENSLTQTVEGVSHRSTYTVSAAVATEGNIVRGASNDAFVGIKVIVHYQDGGEPDVHYLAIPDITDA